MHTRTISVMAAEVDTDGTLNLNDAIAFLRDARNSIPAEHRANAEIWIGSDYDGVTGVSVWYDRPETVSEREERESAERAAEERRRIRKAMMERAPATWWADADRANFDRYVEIHSAAGLDEQTMRVAFHNEAARIHAGAVPKPSWWRELETAEG